MVLDTTVKLDNALRGRRLHADSQAITLDSSSIALDQVQWVRYWVVRNSSVVTFVKVHTGDQWHFEVGRYPFKRAQRIAMTFPAFREKTQSDAWTFLVNLSQRHLEPRLSAELVARVRRGETVDVGALLVHQGGVGTRKVSLPWAAVGGSRVANGYVWIYQTGSTKPAIRVPLENPNAVLIPRMLTALTP
jgi:hypothetical protein